MLLSLFPLNTVLFPGVPLNLHIFEPRYQAMIRSCLAENQPFGVVLIRKGHEAMSGIADPYLVGCSAAIVETEPLGDGRLNIATVGLERFRIRSLDYGSKPYLQGEVEKYPLSGLRDRRLGDLAERLQPWVRRYLHLIADQVPEQIEANFLPAEPAAFAYIAAYLVQAPAAEKQLLLESESMPEMLTRLELLYRRETAIVRALSAGEGPSERGFGMN